MAAAKSSGVWRKRNGINGGGETQHRSVKRNISMASLWHQRNQA